MSTVTPEFCCKEKALFLVLSWVHKVTDKQPKNPKISGGFCNCSLRVEVFPSTVVEFFGSSIVLQSSAPENAGEIPHVHRKRLYKASLIFCYFTQLKLEPDRVLSYSLITICSRSRCGSWNLTTDVLEPRTAAGSRMFPCFSFSPKPGILLFWYLVGCLCGPVGITIG